MINHQIRTFIESSGGDPDAVTMAEWVKYERGMIAEYYPGTPSMNQVGQAKWDDIKILIKSMGHLISNFCNVWDSKQLRPTV